MHRQKIPHPTLKPLALPPTIQQLSYDATTLTTTRRVNE